MIKGSPKHRGNFCLSFGQPMAINDYLNFNIKEFNKLLSDRMIEAENEALKIVGR